MSTSVKCESASYSDYNSQLCSVIRPLKKKKKSHKKKQTAPNHSAYEGTVHVRASVALSGDCLARLFLAELVLASSTKVKVFQVNLDQRLCFKKQTKKVVKQMRLSSVAQTFRVDIKMIVKLMQ